MVARPVVQPATLRDASYVMANLRPADVEEVMCQVPEGVKRHEIAYSLLMSGDAFAALLDDQPVAIFGTAPINAACVSVWALGTPKVWRAVTEINRFLLNVHLPDRIAQGFHTMEARSHSAHHEAHNWIEALGGVQHGGPFEFGRDRETFLLFRWTSAVFESIKQKRGSTPNNQRSLPCIPPPSST